MSSIFRIGCCIAALAVHGFSTAHAQAQLLWHVEASMAQTDNPAAAIRFGADGRIITAGQYRAGTALNIATFLYVRAADGSAVATTTWPPVPTGIYGWNDAAVGSGGEIALCGRAPSGGLIGLASSAGALLWTPQPLPAPFNSALGVTFDPSSGDLLVTGSTSASDIFVVRYSNQGALLGSKIWHHPANGGGSALRIAADGQGNVILLGFADTSGVPRVFVLKLDSALNVLWERERFTLVGAGDLTDGPGLRIDGAGDALVACGSSTIPSQVFTLWKLDPNGGTAWVAQANDATYPNGTAHSVVIDPFGNIAVAGTRSGNVGTEAIVQGYAPNGTLLWSRSTGGSSDAYTSIACDAGGDVLVAGVTGPTPNGLVRRFDRNGNERWTYFDSNKTLRTGVGVAPDGDALVGCSCRDPFQAIPYLHDYRLSSAVFPVCAGDGAVAACPCSNDSPSMERSGCLHSFGAGGHLDGLGQASLAQDTLVLFGWSMPNTSSVIYFQGDVQVAPTVFGDGLRCAGGNLVRLAVRHNDSGASQFPDAGDPTISVAGGVASAGLRMYQAYFRDPASFCTSATFNATNAVRVNWIP